MTDSSLVFVSTIRRLLLASAVVVAPNSGCGESDSSEDSEATSVGTASSGESSDDSASGETGGELDPKLLFDGVRVDAHPEVATVPIVTWTQAAATDSTRVEFSLDDGERRSSPEYERDSGAQREALLGIPEGMKINFRLVAEVDGREYESETRSLTNGMAPQDLPRARITRYEAQSVTHHRWLMGAVSEKGPGGYGGPNWIYIVDRAGRVVWYYRPAGGEKGELNQGFWPRVSRDGTHITIDQQLRGMMGELLFTTLDFEYRRTVMLPGQGDCYDVTDDGHIIYEDRDQLLEIAPDGRSRAIWDCPLSRCYSNTVNWDPYTDSVLLSFPRQNQIAQIDRQSGELIAMMGNDDWSFEPAEYGFDYNHWAHLTAEGTLMVSSHLPDTDTHLFMELALEREQNRLTRVWSYGEDSSDWPPERGMAMKIPGGEGQVLGNYGPEGIIVEITPDKREVWRVEFGAHLLSHSLLLDDLYALNRGPAQR